jgi:hypothetical protein
MGRVKGWYETRLAAEAEEKQRQGVYEVMIGENSNNCWDDAFFNFTEDWENIMGDDFRQQ